MNLAKVYSHANYSFGLRSGDNTGQFLGEKQSGKLFSNHFWVRLALCDGAKSYWKQK
jgi:hypothetical protein